MKDRIGEPETWETIGKTGWLRVETDKGFTYFFHKKKKKTAWSCPPEIAKQVAELDGVLGAAEPEKPPDQDQAQEEPAKDEESKEPEEVPAKPTKAERAEMRERQVEHEQRIAREKEKLRNFKQMMVEKGVKAFDKYEKWLPKLMHDTRFTAVTGQKERKLLFDALAKRIDSEKKKVEVAAKRSGREAFKELLKKAEELDLLQSTVEKALKAMERELGDDDRWDSVNERERERMVAEVVEQINKQKEKEREEANANFRTMLVEELRGKEEDRLTYSHLRRRLQDDPRWAAVPSSERERLCNRISREVEDAKRKRKAEQRQVQLELEEARKKRKMTEAEEKIDSVFAERIKNPFSMSWEEAREYLSESLLASCGLRSEEQEGAFLDYRQRATEARREAWLHILQNAGFDAIGPELEFNEVLERALDAQAAKAFHGMPEEVLETAWQDWRVRAYDLAVEDCQKWLRTSEHLTGCEDVDPTGGDDFDRLLERLKAKDVRFSRLNGRPEEQTRLVAGRLKELRQLREKARLDFNEDED